MNFYEDRAPLPWPAWNNLVRIASQPGDDRPLTNEEKYGGPHPTPASIGLRSRAEIRGITACGRANVMFSDYRVCMAPASYWPQNHRRRKKET